MALTRLKPGSPNIPSTLASVPRILYVEDEDANWRITERYLRGKYELVRARNSAEAFDIMGRVRFDLVLLDIELAGSAHDGLTICRILRGAAPAPNGFRPPPWLGAHLPIVFVTAYSTRYPREELLKNGANEVVTKPVDYTRLLLVSSRLLVQRVRGHSSQSDPW